MPDLGDIEVRISNAAGHWGDRPLSGPARLCLTRDALVLDASPAASFRAPYGELLGGGWRTGVMTIHGAPGSATFEAPRDLDRAWTALVARACPLPELARGHRLLGSRRGGPNAPQARFLTPLIQARRLLEEQVELEARVTAFDAGALRTRMDGALRTIALDAYPTSDPDRRALEAELEEAMGSLFRALARLETAAKAFRSAAEPVRFMAWREWVSAVAAVFASADGAWSGATRLLPNAINP